MGIGVKDLGWKIGVRPFEWILWLWLYTLITCKCISYAAIRLNNFKEFYYFSIVFIFAVTVYYSSKALKDFLTRNKARQISFSNNPSLWALIRRVEVKAGVEVLPNAYIIDNKDKPAAVIAWGFWKKSTLFISQKLSAEASEDELESIIAHELGHIACKETLIKIIQMMIMLSVLALWYAFWLERFFPAGYPKTFSWKLILGMIIIFPYYAFMFNMIFSGFFKFCNKRSELYADAFAAKAVGTPKYLISYLEKELIVQMDEFGRNKKLALFLYRMLSIINSHPTMMKRIKYLKRLE